MPHVFFVLAAIKNTLWPVKLSNTIHLPIFPTAVVAFAIEPSVGPMAMKIIVLKITFVLFKEFDATVVINDKILIL